MLTAFNSIPYPFIRACITAFVKTVLVTMLLCILAGVCCIPLKLVSGTGSELGGWDIADIFLDGTQIFNSSALDSAIGHIIIFKPLAEILFHLAAHSLDLSQYTTMDFFANLVLIELCNAILMLPFLRFVAYMNTRLVNRMMLQDVRFWMWLFDMGLYLIVMLGGTVCTGLIYQTLTILLTPLAYFWRFFIPLAGILLLSWLDALIHTRFLTLKIMPSLLSTFLTFAKDILVKLVYTVAIGLVMCDFILILEHQDAMLTANNPTIFFMWAVLLIGLILIPWSAVLFLKKE